MHLHSEPSLDSAAYPPKMQEFRRRVWWSLYELDRHACLSSKLPFAIQDADFKVNYPCTTAQWASDHQNTAAQSSMSPLYESSDLGTYHPIIDPLYFQLLEIMSQIMVLNRLREKPRLYDNIGTVGDTDIQASSSSLEIALQNWFARLPPWLRDVSHRYSLGFGEGSAGPPPWRAAFVQIMFYFSKTLLYSMMMAASAQQSPAHTLGSGYDADTQQPPQQQQQQQMPPTQQQPQQAQQPQQPPPHIQSNPYTHPYPPHPYPPQHPHPGYGSALASPAYGAPPAMPGYGVPPAIPGYGVPPGMPGYGVPSGMTGYGVPSGMPPYGAPPAIANASQVQAFRSACVEAALAIALIAERFLEHNPNFQFVPLAISTTFYRAGIVLIEALAHRQQTEQHQQPPHMMVYPTSTDGFRIHRALDVLMRSLQNLSRINAQAQNEIETLNNQLAELR
eukprot:jgi/Hompol1/2180/HPOL_001438-RA